MSFNPWHGEERIGEVHGFLYNSILRILSWGQGGSLGMYTSLALNVVMRATESVLSSEQPNGKPLI